MKEITNQTSQTVRTATTPFSAFLLILLVFSLVLAACERTVPRPDVEEPEDTIQVEQPETDPVDPAPPVEPMPEDGDSPRPEDDDPLAETEPPVDESEQPGDAEQPEAEPDAPDPTTPTERPATYTVQAGDTLGLIAQRFGLSIQELAQANNISNVNVLSVGQVLNIPGEGDEPPPADPDPDPGEEEIYIVQRGDNLFRIALRYGLTVDELASYNNLTDPTRIDVGQQLRIPPRQ